jgi:hypothetical protein
MRRQIERFRGNLRLARGRCPACSSEAIEGCGVCFGYYGPFPASRETLLRWKFRFHASGGSESVRGVELSLEPVTAPQGTFAPH